MRILRTLATAMLVTMTVLPAPASDRLSDRLSGRPSPEQVKDIALHAADLLSRQGLDKARPALTEEGPFRFGEIYVNVIDTNGTWLVYPPSPRNEGKSVLNVRDADGKLLVKEIIRLAVDQGEGWVEYRWLNPVSNRIEPKQSYVKLVPELPAIVYVGLYR